MKYSNTVEYNIKTSLDASGLTKLQSEIQKIELKLQQNANRNILSPRAVEEARTQLEGLSTALTKAFNPSLGILDLGKLKTELKDSAVTADDLGKAFQLAGTQGEVAFNNLMGQIGKFDTGLTQTNSSLDKMFTTMSNTFRWGLVSSFFSQFMNAIHQSTEYVKELDDSLTQIMLVTDYNRDSMNQYAKAANEAAKAVGQTTVGMTNASLIFAQQGYDLEQSQDLATLSAKLANASQQDTAAASDQITAYMNAYGLQNDMAALKQAMDNWAEIANISAADVEEIAQASQRAASMANAVGMSGEALAAQIATIESVTREAPEQIGNGLKTLYARFSDLTMGKTDEDGVDLGKVTEQLDAIGVKVLDEFGNIRNMDAIMEDLMDVWADLDDTARVAAAQALAGKYQVNRFTALMDNRDLYEEYVGATGSNATGTLDTMNDEMLDSLQGRMNKLQATWEGLFNNLFETDDVYAFIDVAQKALELVDELVQSMGGGIPVLTTLVSLFTQVFSKNIAQEITRNAQNKELQKVREANAANVEGIISQYGLENAPSQTSAGIVQYIQQGAANRPYMSTEQVAQYNQLLDEQVKAADAAANAQKQLEERIQSTNAAMGAAFGKNNAIFKEDNGEINTSNLLDILNAASESDFKSIKPEDFDKAKVAAKEYAEAISNVETHLLILSDETDENKRDFTNFSNAIDIAQDKLISLYEAGGISKDTFERLTSELLSTTTAMTNWDELIENAGVDLTKLSVEASDLVTILEGLNSGTIRWETLDASVQEAILQLQHAQTVVEQTQGMGNAFNAGIDKQKFTQSIIDSVSALGQLASAISIVQNLGSIWKNENLSDGEKVLQTVLNLSTALPMLVSSLKAMKKASIMLTGAKEAATLADFKQAAASLATSVALGKELWVTGEITAAKWLQVTATQAATVATTGLSAALSFLASGPGLLVIAAIAGIAAVLHHQAEEAEKAKEQAINAFNEVQSKLDKVESIKDKTSNFNDKYIDFKDSGEGSEELIQEANNIADAMREAGLETQGAAIHLAAVRAETNGAAEDFDNLAQEIKKAEIESEVQANNEMIKASDEVLKTQGKTADEMIQKQLSLKRSQEELNNLDPWQPNYEARKTELENLIATLKEVIAEEQKAMDAANAAMQAQGQIAGRKADLKQGSQIAMLGLDNATVRAGTEAKFAGNLDTYSMEQIYGNQVQNFDLLTDLEKVQFMLQTVQDESSKTSLEITELLMTGQKLQYGFGADQRSGTYIGGTADIEAKMSQAGWTNEQALTFVASLDEPKSYEEICRQIDELNQKVKEGQDLDILLQSKLDDSQLEEITKTRLAEYEPTDEDVSKENFKSTSDYLMSHKDDFGKEGAFEDYSPNIINNAEAMEELVEGILRYDNAIETVIDKADDWKQALNSDDIKAQAAAVDELQETYADLLDLPADMEVSEEFAESATNLEDLQAAAEGSEEAYNRLRDAAAEDLVIHAEIEGEENIKAARAAVQGLLEYVNGADFSALNIGDAINLEDVPGKFNEVGNYIDQLAAQTGWSAQQMSDYLNSIGINIDPSQFDVIPTALSDAESQVADIGAQMADDSTISVEAEQVQQTNTVTDTKDYTDAVPHVSPGATWTASFPTFSGELSGGQKPTLNTVSGVVPKITYSAVPKSASETKTDTATATGYKGKQGGDGKAKVQLKKGATASKGAGGGAKHAASSQPSFGGGGGGGGKSCFVAGTLISTIYNFKNIEDIKVGDVVLSYNEQTQQNEYSQVLQTMIHATIEPIYTLYIRNEQLRVTGIHRFLIKRNDIIDWIKAEDLRLGDWVLFADGTWHLILNIDVNVEAQIVYNFEVSHNHNYYVGEHQILAHNKGGGGGGSGSGAKGKTVEAKEHEKHQKKYYEEVEHQLDKTGKILDKVEKTTDKMIGTKARAKQNEQIKLLQKEIQLQEKKLKILQEQEKVDVEKAIKKADSELEKLLSQEGITWKIPDIKFDEDGIIKNTDEINKAIIDGQNKLIDKRNAIANRGEISESEQEEIKRIDKLIDKYKKLGDELGKNNDRYNDIIVEIEDLNNTVDELQDKIQDISIDMYKTSQEAIDNLKELREEWAKFSAEFFYDKSKGEQMLSLDDPLTKAKELNNIMSSIYDISGSDAKEFYQSIIEEQERLLKTATTDQEKKTYQNVINYYKELQKGIDDNISINNGLLQIAVDDLRKLQSIWDNWEENSRDNPIFGDNKAALKERLEDAQKRVQELALEYKKNIEELMDNAVDIAERISDMWDQQLDRFDRVNDQLERYIDSYTLIFGDESYDAQAAVYEQQAKNLEQKLNTAEIAYEQARQRYLEAKERFTDPETGLVDRIFEEQVHALEEAMNDAEDAYRDTAAEAAKLWVEAFEASVNAANKKALQNVFGSAGMDYVERNWEWEKEYNDKYRDDVEKAYELDKLHSKYVNLLNDAQGASLQTQNKIRVQMQEQLDLLENQATVSEYDVKLANAKLEILQKQIALEDAQRNKNKMQLRRDTQGNYRYVYSANQNDVDQARQDLLDTEYDAYELSKNQQIANYDDLLNAFKRYQSQVLEISTNMNLSAEERERQLKELRDKYLEYLELSQEDFEDSTAGTLDILRYLVENGTDYTATSAKNMLEQILDEEGNLIEQSGIFWMDHAVQARDEIIPTIQNAVIEASDAIIDKMYNVRDTLIGTDGTGGIFPEITGWAAEYGDAVNEAANQTEILVTATNHLQDALMADNIAFEEQLTYIQSLTDELGILSDQASATAAQLRSTQEARERAEAEKIAAQSQIDRLLSGEDVIVDHKIISAEELRRQQEEEQRRQSSSGGDNRDAYYYADLIWDYGYWQGPNGWFDNFAAEFGYGLAQAVLDLFNSNYRGAWDAYIGGYDTGGYTGTWDNEGFTDGKNGKLAFLHQKELVLNATDTENILAAVSLMRELTNSAQGLFNGAVKQASANNISSTYNPTTEQRVEIQATFPNATDANDIREAILGLTDKAYQYAHRRI